MHSSENNNGSGFCYLCLKRTPHGIWARQAQAGFTLLEMLIVLVIIGILVGVAVPSYREYIKRTESYQTIVAITAIAAEIDDFFIRSIRRII